MDTSCKFFLCFLEIFVIHSAQVKWFHLGLNKNFCKEHEINQSHQMAADGVLGKVKLEFNSLISFATLPQAFIAVALNPRGNKRLETDSAFLHHSKWYQVQ